ncbi:Uncharacterised protein [uncultured archaeon]|nr:Uncharacterised protein [uncultured archaeon]
MVMTLDQIKGMNLKAGDPIELTINSSTSEECVRYVDMVYFYEIKEETLIYYSSKEILKGNSQEGSRSGYPIWKIGEIRKLEYAD